MKNLSFSIFVYAAASISLWACGDLKSFKDNASYPDVNPGSNGLAEIKSGADFPDNNSGADILAAYIPGSKSQSNSASTLTIGGSVSAYEINQENTSLPVALFYETSNNTPLPDEESFFRETENALLQKEENNKTRYINFLREYKTKEFAEGDIWSGIKVMQTLGDAKVFNIISARCAAITPKAYLFTEINANIDKNLIDKYAREFDRIYPTVRAYFGIENDVDNNGRVIILIYDMKERSTLGYFYSVDKYPSSEYIMSNEADMFYINSYFAALPEYADTVLATLAHEFQHMTYFDYKYNRIQKGQGSWKDYENDSWLNEGLSTLSEHYSGYEESTGNWIAKFLSGNYRGLSLTHWTSANYGYSALFLRYLSDTEGMGIARSIYASGTGGIKSVEKATGKDFNDIFKKFLQTVYLSNQDIRKDPDYNFFSIDLTKYLFQYILLKTGESYYLSLKPYGFAFIRTESKTDRITIPKDFTGYALERK